MWTSDGQQAANRPAEPPAGVGAGKGGQAGARVKWVLTKAFVVRAHKREQANRAACHLLYVLLNKEELTINPLTSFPAPPALVANISMYFYKYTYMFFSAETSSSAITPVILAHLSHVC